MESKAIMSRIIAVILTFAAMAAVPEPASAQRWDRGGWHGDRGRHEGWRREWRGPPPRAYRRGNDVAPLVGGALLGLGLGAVLGGALAPAPGYAAPPPPQYVPPPPAFYAPDKPPPGYYGY